jgi:uncharacterized repeat protein (TIGR01451 family)
LTKLEEYIPEIVTSARSCIPSLSLTKSGPAAVLAGEPFTYTLTLTNTGVLPLAGLVITDVIPAGASYLSGGTNTGGVISWTLDNLAAGETAQVTFAVTTTTPITNSDYRASGAGVKVKGTPPVFTEITLVPNLEISKLGPAAALVGQPITYTLIVTNSGTATTTNLVITDAIPAGATYLSGGVQVGEVVSWTVSSLGIGEASQFTFAVTASQSITNSDYGASAEGGFTATGQSLVSTHVSPAPEPVLSLSKVGPTAVLIGQPITYTLIVTNSGTATATNLVITDVIPAGATYLNGGVQVGEAVSWTVSSLGIGETGQFTFVVTASQSITNSDYGVSTEGGFTATGQNAISTHVSAVPEPVLSLSKAGLATAIAGQPILYTLTITNRGLTTATNLMITDTLPTGASYVGGGVKAGNVISWTLSSLGLEATAQVTFVVTATHSITNSVYGVKATGGFNASGAPAIFTAVSPAPKPLLTIGKQGPAVVAAGAPLTYILTVTNSGTATATNLIITDTLPSGAFYVSGGSKVGNMVSWTVPTLAAGGGMIQKSFVVTATQTLTNSSYGVRADGGYQAKGLTSVTTLVENKAEDKVKTYLPLIIKN